ncbi:MAG: helix-turn-helix domain-containing protein [Thermoguttaceae bacterium]|jgi:hypothetical protein
MIATRQKITPPQLAARYGCDVHKILTLIHIGDLPAIDVATKPGGRPRYLIDERDVEAFERRRSVQAPSPTPTRRRAKQPDIIQFF